MGASIFIISGEESGDLHGSSLMTALKKRSPGATFSGMGGQRMRGLGLDGLDSREVSVVGVAEVAGRLPKILKAFKELKRRLKEGRFDAAVLIDFPDFNLRFAREAKRLGVPVVYYISPQVWAWRRGRVKKIARLVDKMLVIFPFEAAFYREAGVDVEYVGHPLSGVSNYSLTRDEARKALGLPQDTTTVALLPGSRPGEINRLLPDMLKAARLIESGYGRPVEFVLPAAASLDKGFIDGVVKGSGTDVRVVRSRMYEALRASDAAIVASGTATLETALIGIPMVIVYRMAALSYALAKLLVGIKDVGLPNIVAGRRIVPELIQGMASPSNMAAGVLGLLTDEQRRSSVLCGYEEVRERLGAPGAADAAAKAICEVIAGRKRP